MRAIWLKGPPHCPARSGHHVDEFLKAWPSLGGAAGAAEIGIDDAVLSDVTTIDPLFAFKLWEAMEAAAAEAARALWFQPLRPRTRYSLDVVPGPISFFERLAVDGSLAAIYAEKTASGVLYALQKFYKREDALPTLQRVQFTTSRYRTFIEQLANAVAQTKKTAGPVRRLAGASDAVAWFAANGSTQRDRGIKYVAAAKMRGESPLYIMLVEILPNARGPLIVDMCLRTGYNVVIIGALGFLGIGLPPPDPDWGGMVKDTYGMMSVWPHMALFPCAAISSLVIGFNLLAVGLREIGLRD